MTLPSTPSDLQPEDGDGGVPAQPAEEPTDLQRMVTGLEARNAIIGRLAEVVERLTRDVARLRRAVDDRPTKKSLAHKRRRAFALVVLLAGVVLFIQDENTMSCSPGAQASNVLEFIVDRPLPPAGQPRPPLTQDDINDVVAKTTPATACDIAFPSHAHGINRGSELVSIGPFDLTGWNFVGLGLYGSLGVILFLFQRGPNTDDEETPRRTGTRRHRSTT